jgi:hypothetical protein
VGQKVSEHLLLEWIQFEWRLPAVWIIDIDILITEINRVFGTLPHLLFDEGIVIDFMV